VFDKRVEDVFMWLVLPFLIRGNRARCADQLEKLKIEAEKTRPG
jgi:hypothetical protein